MVFFTSNDPYFGVVKVYARGNLSVEEVNDLAQEVEDAMINQYGIKSYFLQTGQFSSVGPSGGGSSEDLIATAYFEFIERGKRKNGHKIMDDLRNELSNISGIKYEVIEETGGPPVGKDLEIRITGPTSDILVPVTKSLRDYIDNLDELISIEDTLPIPLVDWELTIDKPKAAQFGVDIFTIGRVSSMLINSSRLSI
jgi:multidrug efflux pump